MAQLLALLKSLDGLKPEDAAMYNKDGEHYVLDTEKYFHGMSSARDKEKLEAQTAKDRARSLEERWAKFGNVEPTEVEKALQLKQQLEDKKMIDAGKVDELVEQKTAQRTENLKKDLETRLTAAETRALAAETQLSTLLIDNAIQLAATKAGVLPAAMEDVISRGGKIFKIQDGKATPMKGGNIIYGKDGNTPLSMEEWLEELKSKSAHLFEQPEGGGTPRGAGSQKGGTPPTGTVGMGVERLRAARRSGAQK